MSEKPDGGPAFPHDADYVRNELGGYQFQVEFAPGMSLRDWFAGQAMQAIINTTASLHASGDLTSGSAEHPESIANDARALGWGSEIDLKDCDGQPYTWLKYLCEEAYDFADAMLAARDPDA